MKMSKFLKEQLLISILITIGWIVMLVMTYNISQLQHFNCWQACIFTDVIIFLVCVWSWWDWNKRYKKHKNVIL